MAPHGVGPVTINIVSRLSGPFRKAEDPGPDLPPLRDEGRTITMSADDAHTKAKDDNKAATDERANDSTCQDPQMPEINFATFIFSLNSSALVALGVVGDPASGKKEKNLTLAKQTIDILGMLQEKTKGNLSSDEEQLLKNILHDLRIMYVKEC